MRQFVFILLILAFLALSSCDCWIHVQGTVYSNDGHPLEGVLVSLLVNGDSIDYRCRLAVVYDTIYVEKRRKLRRQGVRDNFTENDGVRFYYPISLITNHNGFFGSRLIMAPALLPCPRCQLLFRKEGYKTLEIPTRGIPCADSIIMQNER